MLDGTRECVAMNLNWLLKSTGVRVCSLTTGEPDDFTEMPNDDHKADAYRSALNEDLPSIFHAADSRGLRTTKAHHVYEDLVCNKLEHIAVTRCAFQAALLKYKFMNWSRYPRYSYTLGFRPWVHAMWQVAPDVLKVLLSP